MQLKRQVLNLTTSRISQTSQGVVFYTVILLWKLWRERERENYLESSFDLVVCDYRLPDGDGLELADYIKQRCKIQSAFILISGDTAPETLQAVKERGLHLLHKPVRPAKLRSLMLFLLKRRDQEI